MVGNVAIPDHSKEVPNMATNMSRRVFLKCAGAAALAVTASGIFAGCSPSGGGSKDTVYGVGESTQINGVNVKLLGYRQDKISGMVGNYAGKTFITVCIGLENQSEQTVKMGNTTETELAEVLKAIYNNQYETLGKSDFKMTSDSGKAHRIFIAPSSHRIVTTFSLQISVQTVSYDMQYTPKRNFHAPYPKLSTYSPVRAPDI
jgi:hypothetical protein